ncbi:MAG TPA: IS200/IS605 family transposase [Pirellulaceae bacterium]|nr:IS200/IS605 family transposase [Pirellulaceae bacterium]
MAGTYTNLLYHVVFSTKERRRLITPVIEDELHKYIGGIVRNLEGDLLEANGDLDHRHLLILLKPKFALSDVVRDIKANSSGWLNERSKSLHKFGWQDGFAAFTVSKSQVPRVSSYIRNQKNHHQKTDFKTELRELLAKNQIEFDERYLWR